MCYSNLNKIWRGGMTCTYYVYCKYCEKKYIEETKDYFYSDLTECKCEYKNDQEKCPYYIQKYIKKPLKY